jgi:hypothetical protein
MVSSELEPIYLRTVIRAVAGLGEPIELSGGVRAPSPPSRHHQRQSPLARILIVTMPVR